MINCIDREGSMSGYDIDLVKHIYPHLNVPLTINGGCGSTAHMMDLINQLGLIGLGVGSFFVFKGRFRAVMISYDKPSLV